MTARQRGQERGILDQAEVKAIIEAAAKLPARALTPERQAGVIRRLQHLEDNRRRGIR